MREKMAVMNFLKISLVLAVVLLVSACGRASQPTPPPDSVYPRDYTVRF